MSTRTAALRPGRRRARSGPGVAALVSLAALTGLEGSARAAAERSCRAFAEAAGPVGARPCLSPALVTAASARIVLADDIAAPSALPASPDTPATLPIAPVIVLPEGADRDHVISAREEVAGGLVLTPFADTTVGPAGPRLGERFDQAVDYQSALVFLWPARPLHEALYTRTIPITEDLDDYGLPRGGFHRFEVAAGPGVALLADGNEVPVVDLRFEGEILDVSAERRHGDATRVRGSGTSSSIAIRATRGDGADACRLFAKVGLGAYFAGSDPPPRAPREYHVFAGAASAFEYSTHRLSRDREEQLSVLNVVGPSVDVWALVGGVRLRGGLEAYGDFAAVRSPAVEAYVRSRARAVAPNGLALRSYYYAIGGTARLRVSAELRGIEVGAALAGDVFSSVEDPWSRIRRPPPGFTTTDRRFAPEPHAGDRRVIERLWVATALPGGHMKITWIDLEHVLAVGEVGAIGASAADTRIFTRIGATF